MGDAKKTKRIVVMRKTLNGVPERAEFCSATGFAFDDRFLIVNHVGGRDYIAIETVDQFSVSENEEALR